MVVVWWRPKVSIGDNVERRRRRASNLIQFRLQFRVQTDSPVHSPLQRVQPGRVVDWLILELYENPGIRVYRVNSFV